MRYRDAIQFYSPMRNLAFFIISGLASVHLGADTWYVSPGGSDRNSGRSPDQAFQVVQHAIDQMSSGDTLVVMDGFYQGRVNLKSGITIKAENPRKAVFSQLQQVSGRWEKHTDTVYRVKIPQAPKLVLFNGEPLTWACWPDIRWSENWQGDRKWAKATDGTGPGVLTSESFESIRDLDLEGAYCFIRYGKGNSCYSRPIESFDGTTLQWNDDDFYTQKFTGEDGWRGTAEAIAGLREGHPWHPRESRFFLAGAYDLLDVPGEWFVQGDTLYLIPPDGKDPNGASILIQAHDYAICEEGPVSSLIIEGMDFVGCSVKFEAAGNDNILFRDAHFTYIGAELLYLDRVQGEENDKAIFVEGTGIHFEKCLFYGAKNSALKLVGSDMVVENCVFMEINRHGNFESRAVVLAARGDYRISRNTFFNLCSDAIRVTIRCEDGTQPQPEISYNNVFNAGKYNSDVSGIYLPIGRQYYTDVHHNWIHNINGNALRLDLAGKELNAHHNVFWSSKRGMSIEGYGGFNIYNNTSVMNEEACDIIRNVTNHGDATDASMDMTFPPIDDWNVLNNLVEKFDDKAGPRERGILLSRIAQNKEVHPERSRLRSNAIPVVNRGSLQGNLTGFSMDIFTSGDLSGLNLIPKDPVVRNGVSRTRKLAEEGVTALGSYIGAYDIDDDYWYPGSDWMPYGLPVPTTMAESERFAKAVYSQSILPELNIAELPAGRLD